MANIQLRKSVSGESRYRVQVRIKGFPPQYATFAHKTDAKEWAQKAEAALRAGHKLVVHQTGKQHTLAELIEHHLKSVARKRAHAYAKQLQILTWWKIRLGRRLLSRITPQLVSEQRELLLKENIGTAKNRRYRSSTTANRYLAALSKACSVAVRELRWMQENPVRAVSKDPERSRQLRFLSPAEKDALLIACGNSPMQELELIVILASTTGMRRGEILALRWGDIDLARGRIVLRKTKLNDERAVPIAPAALALLGKQAQLRHEHTDFVFGHPRKDRAIHIDHAFIDAVHAAQIKDFRFHDLRHTAASYLSMSGATIEDIAAMLGYKTAKTIERYAQLYG